MIGTVIASALFLSSTLTTQELNHRCAWLDNIGSEPEPVEQVVLYYRFIGSGVVATVEGCWDQGFGIQTRSDPESLALIRQRLNERVFNDPRILRITANGVVQRDTLGRRLFQIESLSSSELICTPLVLQDEGFAQLANRTVGTDCALRD